MIELCQEPVKTELIENETDKKIVEPDNEPDKKVSVAPTIVEPDSEPESSLASGRGDSVEPTTVEPMSRVEPNNDRNVCTAELVYDVELRTSVQLLEDQGSSKGSSIDGLSVQIPPEIDDHCMIMDFSNVATEQELGLLNGCTLRKMQARVFLSEENRINRGEAICLSIVALVLFVGGWVLVSFSYS
jgi:hypothetical protein